MPKLRGIAAGLKNKSKRSLDLFNVAYGAYEDARREADLDVEERPSWFLEVGQSVERSPWGASLPLVSRKARIYHYGLDTVLCGKQLAACHGYPHALDLGTLSEPQFRGLLGNGVFLPHLTICTAAAFLEESAPWHTSEGQSSGGFCLSCSGVAFFAEVTWLRHVLGSRRLFCQEESSLQLLGCAHFSHGCF